MTDKIIAAKLIQWVKSIKIWIIKDEKEAYRLAIKELSEIKKKYGWLAMKKAYKAQDCISIEKFKTLCQKHKELIEKSSHQTENVSMR